MATQVPVPTLGESVTSATLLKWHKADGEAVKVDEPICELETDKANVDVNAPIAGVLHRSHAEGAAVKVGEVIATIDPAGKATSTAPASQMKGESEATKDIPSAAASSPADVGNGAPMAGSAPTAKGQSAQSAETSSATAAMEDLSPAARRVASEFRVGPGAVRGTGPGGRITKEDLVAYVDKQRAADDDLHEQQEKPATEIRGESTPEPAGRTVGVPSGNGERRVAMTKIRKRIADNLLRAQQTAAILTTFNEADMSAIMALRSKYKEPFEKANGIGLGFMSFFVKAAVAALKEFPAVNGRIDGTDIVYHDYVHMGVAVSTERGLAVPVLRNVQDMSFARIETEIKRVATAVRDGKLGLDELSGGTFTITNGGIFGSLLSTPILNSPQSGILGMHTIQKRPVAIDDKVEIRPMMYLALSYDHRLVDGREAVSFLVRMKQSLEDPARMMLGL